MTVITQVAWGYRGRLGGSRQETACVKYQGQEEHSSFDFFLSAHIHNNTPKNNDQKHQKENSSAQNQRMPD